MIESDFSLYGKTDGILQLEPAATIVCGVVCGGWPSWAMGAEARGLSVKYIITKTNVWTNYIKGWFPKADIIEYTDSFDWQLLESNVNVWLSDVAPPRRLKLWDSSAILIVLGRRARHLQPSSSWKMTPFPVSHASCGGVTDGSWDIYIYSRLSAHNLLMPHHSSAGRH
jgi:hypothetical protein